MSRFQPAWQEHLDWWKGEEPGANNNTSEFARYLVESLESGQTSEFPAAFSYRGSLSAVLSGKLSEYLNGQER